MKFITILAASLFAASALTMMAPKPESVVNCFITTDRAAAAATLTAEGLEPMHAEDGLSASVGNTLAAITCKNSTFTLSASLKCDPKFAEVNIVVDEGKPNSKVTKIQANPGHNEYNKNDLVNNLKNITADNAACQFRIGSAGLFAVFSALIAAFVALF